MEIKLNVFISFTLLRHYDYNFIIKMHFFSTFY